MVVGFEWCKVLVVVLVWVDVVVEELGDVGCVE